MQNKKYLVVLSKDGDNISANVPALPGCITYGETKTQAIGNAMEAIKGFIKVLQDEGESVPDNNHTEEIYVSV